MKFVDLSHPIANNMSTYPSDPDVSIVLEKEIDKDRSLLHHFTMGTHTGTHLDVPSHIIHDGKNLGDFPLSTFKGTAVKVDKNSYSSLDQINENFDGIIYETGWYKHFKESKKFYGTVRSIIPESLVNEAVKMRLNFFGCDLPSVDTSGSNGKPVHHALLGAEIIVYESLTNLDQLPVLTPFEFYGFPLPFKELDGSPVRAVGVI